MMEFLSIYSLLRPVNHMAVTTSSLYLRSSPTNNEDVSMRPRIYIRATVYTSCCGGPELFCIFNRATCDNHATTYVLMHSWLSAAGSNCFDYICLPDVITTLFYFCAVVEKCIYSLVSADLDLDYREYRSFSF